MKKTKLFKSLLLAAGMLAGSANAWAQSTETVTVLSEDYESYDAGDITATMQSKGWTFQSRNNKNEIKIVQGAADGANSTKYFDFYYPDGGASRNQSWNMGVSTSLDGSDNWTLSFSAALNPGTNNSANVFYIVGTKSGKVTSANDAVTNPFIKLAGTAAGAVTYVPTIGSTEYEQITLTSGAWYDFTVKATAIDAEANTATLYVKIASGSETVFEQTITNFSTANIGTLYGLCWNSPRGWSRLSLDDVLVTKEVDASICADPTYTVTGANGTSRKFTLACETSESTIYYATSELEKGADGWTEYVSEVTTEAATIYAYAAKGTTTSAIISFATGAGEEIALNVPIVFTNGLVANGEYFNAILNASYNAAGVEFTPVATLTATFTPKGGTATNVTLPYTATERGQLTVTAAADGFASTSTTIEVYASYEQGWQSVDFSSLIGIEAVQAALGEDWTLQSGHGRWASWKEAEYNFYQHGDGGATTATINDRISMRNVVLLAEGMGLGRNVTGGEAISVKNTTAGDIVAFEIYNGYGNDINKGTNTHMSYVLSNGTDNPSMSSTNGALLVQATVYTPAKTTFTAKYYNSKGWENVYAYTYNGETLGGWTGTELTAGEDGLYNVTFESVDAPEKIIFNNGETGDDNPNKQQTGDLDFVDGAAYNYDGQGDIYSFTFTTDKGWSNVYAYTWSGADATKVEQLGAWNGTQLTATDGTYALTFVAATAPEYIIFHNGEGAKTADLTFTNGEAYEYNTTVVAAGVEALFGSDWNGTDENNKMTKNADGTYSLKITGKELAVGEYGYKAVIDGNTWIPEGDGTEKKLGVKMAGTYDITFTYNPSTSEITDAMAIYKTITDAGYATYCSPYDLNFEGTGVKAYVGTQSGATVTFTEVKSAKAGTGLLLKANQDSYAIAMETSDNTVENNALVGVLEDTEVPAGSFVLMNTTEYGVGFYKTSAELFTVGANTAYIKALPASGSRNFIALNFGDNTTTAIEGVATVTMESDAVFNLQGQRVNAAKKGLYIVNGKKMILK